MKTTPLLIRIVLFLSMWAWLSIFLFDRMTLGGWPIMLAGLAAVLFATLVALNFSNGMMIVGFLMSRVTTKVVSHYAK